MKFKVSDKRIVLFYVIAIVFIISGITYALMQSSISFSLSTGDYGIDETAYGNTYFSSASLNMQPILDSKVDSSLDNVIKIDFTVGGNQNNPSNKNIIYDIALVDLDLDCQLLSPYLKWKLLKNGEVLETGSFANDFDTIVDGRLVLTTIQQDLATYSATKAGYHNYSFYVWLSDSCQESDISECENAVDQSDLLTRALKGKIEVELNTGNKKEHERIGTPNTDNCVNTQRLIYDAQGGQVEPSFKNIKKGETYGELPTPTRDNYTFEGWYTNTSYDTKVTSSTVIDTDSNVILYAKWTADNYNVIYNLSTNGSFSSDVSHPASAKYGEIVHVGHPVRTGYTFDNWTSGVDDGLVTSTALTGSDVKNVSTSWSGSATRNEYFKNLNNNKGTVTFQANWTANTYQVAYQMNGANDKNGETWTYDTVYPVDKPTKTFTVNITNNTGASVLNASGNAVSSASSNQTFAGWSADNNLNTSEAVYGTSSGAVTSKWSTAGDKVGANNRLLA